LKVVYLGRATARSNAPPSGDEDVIELLSNNWNDYGYETTFATVCRVNGESLELGGIRLLISGETNSRKFLNARLKEGWDGTFPIPDVDYISTPSEIAFYEQLDGALSGRQAVTVATSLRDASYLIHVEEDESAAALANTDGFRDSLQRERGSIEAYLDAWRILDRESIAASDIAFAFRDVFKDVSKINLRFTHTGSALPHDINVLIGANGVGKSRILHQLVDAWTADGDDQDPELGFETPPNVSRLVVISYSPFELFPVDMASSKLQDKATYQYFSIRGRSAQTDSSDSSGLPSIRLSRAIPKKDAANSLLSCIADDQRYRVIKGWGQKIATAERVLRTAIDFDHMALEVDAKTTTKFFDSDVLDVSPVLEITRRHGSRRYVRVDEGTVLGLNHRRLAQKVVSDSGVVFIKGERPQELSSGQRLFTYPLVARVRTLNDKDKDKPDHWRAA
jgi:hypothetical protein